MALHCDFDDGYSAGGALGLIVLKTDETLEVETRGVFAKAGVPCYHARIPNQALVTNEALAEMKEDLPHTASLLPPGVPFGSIGYACTSGATVIGQDNVAKAINQHHPGTPVTDPITAVMAGLKAVGAASVGVLTPYLPEVTAEMQALLVQNGFNIARLGSFEQIEDRLIARISEDSTLAAIEEIGSDPACEAVFASCTNLRTFEILDEAERRIGKPVISSNQALAWHLLTLAGIETAGMGPGRLFEMG